MSEQEKPKRKRRTPEEMAAARAAGEVKPKQPRKKKEVLTKENQVSQPLMNKPPTQGVGVHGFSGSVFGSDVHGVPWEKLIHLPKFQRYCIEKTSGDYATVMDWIIEFCVAELNKDASTFFEEYKAWHEKLGYWNNETIFGELIEND